MCVHACVYIRAEAFVRVVGVCVCYAHMGACARLWVRVCVCV